MFTPPFCPRRSCPQHRDPRPNFFHRHGHYWPKCRAHPVPRFRCRSCRHTFSRQTFRADYHDKRPDLNARLLDLVTMGVGIRMCSRRLRLSLRCTELKLRKIGRHLRQLNLNLRFPVEREFQLQFDEIETFECRRNTRPLSVPVLLDGPSRYLIWAESATIRPRGKMTKKRLQIIADEENRLGVRKDRSRRAVQRTLKRGREIIGRKSCVTLFSDEKVTYPALARAAFGKRRLTHLKTNSKVARMTWNPLFPINHEDARLRDMSGRLRRQSWLVSKKWRFLDLALQAHMAVRNLVRTRFNYDEETPAQLMGYVHRPLTMREVLSWRQLWGGRSIHPLSPRRRSVDRYQESMRSAG
jgi:transposase-like protein